ncbi:MAG TPA: hypothetical protein VJZ51_05860 [Bacilli bacterium]|nr:hypothetical protein [Bacilli bacterium]
MTLKELLSHFCCKSELEYISINVDDNVAVQLSCFELNFEHDEYLDYEVKNWTLDCADNTLSIELLSNKLNDASNTKYIEVLTLEEAIQEAQRDYKERGSVFEQTIGNMIEYIAYNCKGYEYLREDIEISFISKAYEEIYDRILDYLSKGIIGL